MVDPRKMCRQHLLGEHVECHMFTGVIQRGKNIQGYIIKGLVEVHNIKKRHDELAWEMLKRGYKHSSPISSVSHIISGKIDPELNAIQLNERCKECRKLRK